MKKLLFTLLLAAGSLTGWADTSGWFSGSITIGGSTTDCTAWSTNSSDPTDLGIVTNMTVTSVAFNIWSDANDRNGANMFFRIWDGGASQVGSDQDLHLGAATFILGSTHDYSISWTGTFDLASAVSLTLVPGKTYYVDMWAKSYGVSGDEWYSGGSANFHAKLKYAAPLTLTDDTDNTSNIDSNVGVYANVTLSGRTLQTGGWNTFCVPFNLDTPSGWTVKELTSSSLSGNTLTLTFSDAASIAAGNPYLVRVDETVASPTFSGVTIASVMTNTTTTYADFVPVMSPTSLTGGDKSVLFVSGGNTLTYPSGNGDINAFRAYFQLKGDAAGVKAFNMSFEEDDATAIEMVNGQSSMVNGPVYNLAGQRLNNSQFIIHNSQLPCGIYIVNGKKVIIK